MFDGLNTFKIINHKLNFKSLLCESTGVKMMVLGGVGILVVLVLKWFVLLKETAAWGLILCGFITTSNDFHITNSN